MPAATPTRFSPHALSVLAERIDADATVDFYRAATGDIRKASGAEGMTRGGATLVVAARVDILALNRVLAVGLAAPAAADEIDAWIDVYASRRVPRFLVQLAPAAKPQDLAAQLEARGFRQHGQGTRMVRAAGDPPAVAQTSLRIGQISEASALAWAEIIARAFTYPLTPMVPWLAASVGRPGWRHYAAWDGPTVVATGSLYTRGDVGTLQWGATRPEHRGRGAHTALIAARISDATDMGCRWLLAETAEDTPEQPSPSLHNLRRLGFEPAYHRPNFLWTHDGSTA